MNNRVTCGFMVSWFYSFTAYNLRYYHPTAYTQEITPPCLTFLSGYLERGTEQVWVIFPETREILVYRHDQPDLVRAYRDNAKIDLSAFFPGVEIGLDEVFRLPTFE